MKLYSQRMFNGKRLLLFMALSVSLVSASHLPYVNVFLHRDVLVLALWISVTLLWRMPERMQFCLSLVALVFAMVFIFLKKPNAAEDFGNAAYALLTIGVIQTIGSFMAKKP